MVVPLSLENFWNAFWANDAPYFVPAFMTHGGDEIVSATDWQAPSDETDFFYINTPVDSQRIIKRKLEPKGSFLSRVTRETEYISEIERNETKITLKVVKLNKGSMYAPTYEQWAKWEFVTPDPQSEQVAVRQSSVTRWAGNRRPFNFAKHIEEKARAAREKDVDGLEEFFEFSAKNYLDGLPNGPFANAIWPQDVSN